MRVPFPSPLVLLLASVLWCPVARGQWSIAADIGADRFWGGSIQNNGERRSFRPYRPTTVGLSLGWQRSALGAGLRFRYASAGLALEGADAVVAVKGVFKVFTAAPEIACRVTSVGPGNHLVLHAGPMVELWSVEGGTAQTRIGLHGAVSLNVPLGERLAGSIAGGIAVMPSPFARNQLQEGFSLRALWRRRIAAGIEYQL